MKSRGLSIALGVLILMLLALGFATALRAARERHSARISNEGPSLILNGEFIPGPYVVEVLDGNELLINGKPLYSPRDPAPLEIPTDFVSHGHIIHEIETRGRDIALSRGIDAANEWTLDFLRSRPEVAVAEKARGSSFAVRWTNEPREEVRVRLTFDWLPAPDDTVSQLTPDGQADELRRLLNQPGALVVLSDGVIYVVPPSRSADKLKSIRQICADTEDTASRAERLQLEAGLPEKAATMIATRLTHK